MCIRMIDERHAIAERDRVSVMSLSGCIRYVPTHRPTHLVMHVLYDSDIRYPSDPFVNRLSTVGSCKAINRYAMARWLTRNRDTEMQKAP
jgi:hypothetical protein